MTPKTQTEIIKSETGRCLWQRNPRAKRNTTRRKMLTVMAATSDLADRIDCRQFLKALAEVFGGGAGGRKDFAQGKIEGDPDFILAVAERAIACLLSASSVAD